MDTTAVTPYVLEQGQRLSASMLWRLQRRFFNEQTIDAWRNSIVPHYVTSNTFIAQAYARLVFGYLRDLVAAADAPLRPELPLYVLELGAGSGRFSYHFLKKFFAMLRKSSLRHLRVTYVMSDLCERNVAFWQQHRFLQPYVEQGLLDFARVDLSQPGPVLLRHSGTTLSAGTAGNPLVVLANYVFDGIEQDAFYVNDGILHESQITLTSDSAEPVPDDASLLERLRAHFTPVPTSTDYYPEAGYNQILATYQQQLVNSHVLLPVQTLRYLDFLRRLCDDRLLLISGDKGVGRAEDLLFATAPAIARHGSISMMVNYHAIGQYVTQQGGLFMTTPQRHHHLHIGAAVFDATLPALDAHQFVETQQAFTEHIADVSPDDFYVLKRFVLAHAGELDLEQLLAYLRLSGWDAANFWGCYAALTERCSDLQGPLRREVAQMVEQVWDTYFFLGEDSDLAYALSSLLYAIDHYPQAIRFLEHSRALFGDAASTLYNLAMCHYNLRQLPVALEHIDAALQLDPAYEPARVMRITILSELT